MVILAHSMTFAVFSAFRAAKKENHFFHLFLLPETTLPTAITEWTEMLYLLLDAEQLMNHLSAINQARYQHASNLQSLEGTSSSR